MSLTVITPDRPLISDDFNRCRGLCVGYGEFCVRLALIVETAETKRMVMVK